MSRVTPCQTTKKLHRPWAKPAGAITPGRSLLPGDIPSHLIVALHQTVFKRSCVKMLKVDLVSKGPEQGNARAKMNWNLRHDQSVNQVLVYRLMSAPWWILHPAPAIRDFTFMKKILELGIKP